MLLKQKLESDNQETPGPIQNRPPTLKNIEDRPPTPENRSKKERSPRKKDGQDETKSPRASQTGSRSPKAQGGEFSYSNTMSMDDGATLDTISDMKEDEFQALQEQLQCDVARGEFKIMI